MTRKLFIAGAVVFATLVTAVFALLPGHMEKSFNQVLPHEPYVISDRARKLHASLVVADLHADTLLWQRDLLQRGGRGHVDVPRLIEGGVVLQVFSTVTKVPAGLNYEENTAESDQITRLAVVQRWPLRSWHSLLERARYQAQKLAKAARDSGGKLVLVQSRADLESVLEQHKEGRGVVGGLLATEGSHALEGSLDNIAKLYDEGFRMMSLHHFFDNELGGSLHGTSRAGLSDFGRAAIREMNRQGIVIDVAHSSPRVVTEALEISSTPLVVSHTGVHGACDSPRNIPDELLHRVAAGGGLIGIGYWDAAVCDVTPAGIASSIAYAVDLLGAEHVALGSDFDGATTVPFDTSELAALTAALLDAGLEEDTIRAVMGGNEIRFFRQHLPAP